VKKEKTKGDKFDVFVHSSNVIVTGLNSDDKWRMSKLEGKNPSSKKNENSKDEKTKKVDSDTIKKETKVEKTKKKDTEK